MINSEVSGLCMSAFTIQLYEYVNMVTWRKLGYQVLTYPVTSKQSEYFATVFEHET